MSSQSRCLLTVIISLLLFAISLLLIVYSLKHDNYLLVIGLLLMFIPFALGFELPVHNECPPYFVSVYSTLPVCRYEFPHYFSRL